MKTTIIILCLAAILGIALGAPIIAEKDWDKHVSEKYPPELIQRGWVGFFRYLEKAFDKDTHELILSLDDKDKKCLEHHPGLVLFFTEEDDKNWNATGCEEYHSVKIEKIYRKWNAFLDDMPATLRAPYRKAYENIVGNNLHMEKNVSMEFALEYLKATDQVLKLNHQERWHLGQKYPGLQRFLIGDFYEPLTNLIEPLIELGEVAIKINKGKAGFWDQASSLPSLHKVYKHSFKLFYEAKQDFLEFAEKEKNEPSQDKLGRIFREVGPKGDDKKTYRRMGALFDLLDAYDELCNKPKAWYQIGAHLEKWLTCY